MSKSSCDEIKAMLFEYMDGRLSEADREKVEEHFLGCADCKKEYEQYQALRVLVRDSAYRPKRDLSAAFMDAAAGKKPVRSRLRIRYTAISTIAAALVIVAAVFLAAKLPFGKFDSRVTSDSASGAVAEEMETVTEMAVMYSASLTNDGNPIEEEEVEEVEEAVGDADADEYGKSETVPETAAPSSIQSESPFTSRRATGKGQAELPSEDAVLAPKAPDNAAMSGAAEAKSKSKAEAEAEWASYLEKYAPEYADTVSLCYIFDRPDGKIAGFAAENCRLLAEDEACSVYLWEGDMADLRAALPDDGGWREYGQEVSDAKPCALLVLKK